MGYCPNHPGVEVLIGECLLCKQEELRQIQADLQIAQGKATIEMQLASRKAMERNLQEERKHAALDEEHKELRAGLAEFSQDFRHKWLGLCRSMEIIERSLAELQPEVRKLDADVTFAENNLAATERAIAEDSKQSTQVEKLAKARESCVAALKRKIARVDRFNKENPDCAYIVKQYKYMYGEIRRVGSEILRGWRVPDRKITAQGCPSCGGPVTSESRQCPYCNVNISF